MLKFSLKPELSGQILKPCILILAYLNLLLPLLKISNVSPAIILGLLGLCTYFLADGNRISGYALFCCAYFAYMLIGDRLIFPEPDGVAVYRSLASAFFSGAAIRYALREEKILYHRYLSSIIILVAIISLAAYIFNLKISENFFTNGGSLSRLKLFMGHPNTFGYMSSVVFTVNAILLINIKTIREYYKNKNEYFSAPVNNFLNLMSGKYILVISIIISFIMLIMTYSRTSLYAAMFTILVVCILKFANKNVIKVIVASGMTVVVFLVAIHNFDMERINSPELKRLIAPLQNPLNASSFRSRLPIWLSALDAAKQSPWLGSGPKSFRKKHNREFVKEHYVELTSRFGKNVIDLDTVRMPNAHNQFLQMLIDYGVIGLIFFLGALLYPLLIAVRRRCCFGLLAPLLIHYCLYSLADNTLDGYIAYFPAFVVFSSLGYFACLRAGPESVVSGPARAPLAARPASGSL